MEGVEGGRCNVLRFVRSLRCSNVDESGTEPSGTSPFTNQPFSYSLLTLVKSIFPPFGLVYSSIQGCHLFRSSCLLFSHSLSLLIDKCGTGSRQRFSLTHLSSLPLFLLLLSSTISPNSPLIFPLKNSTFSIFPYKSSISPTVCLTTPFNSTNIPSSLPSVPLAISLPFPTKASLSRRRISLTSSRRRKSEDVLQARENSGDGVWPWTHGSSSRLMVMVDDEPGDSPEPPTEPSPPQASISIAFLTLLHHHSLSLTLGIVSA